MSSYLWDGLERGILDIFIMVKCRMAKKKADLPLNPNIELFQWGPVPGRFFYPSDYVAPMPQDLMDTYGECWPPSLFLFHGRRMVWLNEDPIFRKRGKNIFRKYMLSKEGRERMRNDWREGNKTLFAHTDIIEKTDLTKLSEKEFLALWQDFYKHINAFWLPTIIQELGTYGSEGVLSDLLLARGVHKQDIPGVMEILTAPDTLSFYRKEEIELANASDIVLHQKKYFWLKNSYNGSSVLSHSFFEERKRKLPKDLHHREEKRMNETKKRKADAQRKYKLPKRIMDIADAVAFGIEWQDERKGYIFLTIHHKTLLLAEASRRLGVALEQLLDLPFFETEKYLTGEQLRLSEKREFFGIHQNERQSKLLSEEEAESYWNIYVEGEADKNIRSFRGITVSVGKGGAVRGRVKILLDPHDLTSFKEGDILVTSMTSPEYVFAMKKAGAIITDTGGLTSHAAVTSRELGKPCIVGTKVATKVLKDDDLVEVDAKRGIVTLLEKADGGKRMRETQKRSGE